MVPLSRKEQRGLRNIERGLLADDPVLARLLSEPVNRAEPRPPHAHRRAVRVAVGMISLGMVQFLSGLVADERQMMWGGVLVLALSPFITALVLAASRNDSS
jgi:DUF3040 family protein